MAPLGGYQILLGVEVMQAEYRNSFANPEPLQPNQVIPLSFHISEKFHTFEKGHRIILQAHSSQFPANDRNPRQLMDGYQAGADDYRNGVQSIYKSMVNPSHLMLPVMIKKLHKAVKSRAINFAR